MSFAFLTIAGLLAFVTYQSLRSSDVKNIVSKCTYNSSSLPLLVVVEGCFQAPCFVRQGSEAVISVAFTAHRNITNMTTIVTAYLDTMLGISIPVPCDLGEKADTCAHLTGTTCPVQVGTLIGYSLTLDIPDAIPTGITPTVEINIEDERGLPVVCFSVPVTIKPSPNVKNDTISSFVIK